MNLLELRFRIGKYKTNHKLKAAWFLLTLLVIQLFYSAQAISADVLSIGIFPRHNSTVTKKMYLPLAKHLSAELKMPVRIETSRSFEVFWENVTSGKYDIVHLNQLQYILSNEKVGYQVFAKNEEFNRSDIAPAIVVRKDSGINSISDLKGKTIIFGGGKTAMISFIGTHDILLENDLSSGDFRFMFSRNPPNATVATYYKKADAAGVGDIALEIPATKNKVDVNELKILTIGTKQPHIPWAVHPRLSPALKDKITRVFLNLKNSQQGITALKWAALTDILPASDNEYDVSRFIYKKYKAKMK